MAGDSLRKGLPDAFRRKMSLVSSETRRFGQYLFRATPLPCPVDSLHMSPVDEHVASWVGMVLVVGAASSGVFNRPSSSAIYFRDLAKPVAVAVGERTITAAVSRRKAPGWLLGQNFGGSGVDGGRPLVRLLSSHLVGLAEVADSMTAADGIAALEAAFVLGRMVSEASLAHTRDQPLSLDRSRYEAAIRMIDRNILSPELSIEFLSANLRLSRSTIFRLFGTDNGVNGYIRGRRLELAHEALKRRADGQPTVGEIARIHCFTSESHFSRAFRRVYGQSPGAAAALGPRVPDGPE